MKNKILKCVLKENIYKMKWYFDLLDIQKEKGYLNIIYKMDWYNSMKIYTCIDDSNNYNLMSNWIEIKND